MVRRLLAVLLVSAALPAGTAAAKGYEPGYYSGHTSQGSQITFVVANGQVSDLLSEITDSCHPGKWYVTLYPRPARINSRGDWSHRTPGSLPTVYNGHLNGGSASGTIDDKSKNSTGRTCHGRVSYHAKRGSPVRLGAATVGSNGTDVLIRLSVPAGSNGNETVPYTSLALLVYGSNTGCRTSYKAADAQARNMQSDGFIGLISDAYVTEDYSSASIKGHSHGVFMFDVSTNTIVRTASGGSPFSSVCAMLYRGTPATLTPARNVALAGARSKLVPGAGPPVTQP